MLLQFRTVLDLLPQLRYLIVYILALLVLQGDIVLQLAEPAAGLRHVRLNLKHSFIEGV